MQQLLNKVKKVDPIVRLRRQKVDEETAALNVIRKEKVTIVSSMKESQKKYLDGFETLNQVRSSGDRRNLATLEGALDSVKDQWHRLMLKVQEVERRETAQLTHLLTAERDLRAVEKLKERYVDELKQTERKADQKLMDEHALRRFLANRE